jgi:hypothetical protein
VTSVNHPYLEVALEAALRIGKMSDDGAERRRLYARLAGGLRSRGNLRDLLDRWARGLLHPAYIMDVVGMGLMLWGARAALKRQTVAPAILAVAWSWTAATMWRATVDRFWYASLGRELYAGRVELWLAPVITVLAVLPMIASLAVVLKQARSE